MPEFRHGAFYILQSWRYSELKDPIFTGSCTAMITPFTPEGIDIPRLQQQIAFQAEHGTSAILVAGTTGENATLNGREYEKLLSASVRFTEGRMKVLAGIGGNNTRACLEKAEFAAAAGADAVLMTAPYYNKTTQAGLVEHFRYVADRSSLPLILYNVPGRTAIGIGFDTYAELAQHPNIVGTKEASGDFSLISRLAAECEDFCLWCGNDDQTVPMMALGAKGVISVASNLIPGEISRLCRLCLDGNFSEAARFFRSFAALDRLLFAETNPIPVKAAMAMAGTDSGMLRLPLVPMSEKYKAALRDALLALGIPCGSE